MTVSQWHKLAADSLRKSGDPDAKTDSSLFLCAVLDVALSRLRFLPDDELTEEQQRKLDEMLMRRMQGEPEQYIEGFCWFMGYKFRSDKRALIPRQDTETLCEAALNEIRTVSSPKVLDLCCGSGCIAAALAAARPDASVTACDISADAIELTKENAALCSVVLTVLQGDGFEPVAGQVFDLIVCNPPYLSADDMQKLQAEVRHEPAIALFGGEDGLDFYRRFAAQMKPCLKGGAAALFEVGMGQASEVKRIFGGAFPHARVDTVKDLNGIERVVRVRT